MDTNTIRSQTFPKTLVEALEIAEQFLADGAKGCVPYICIAARMAEDNDLISKGQRAEIIGEVFRMIHPHITLAGYLHSQRRIPETLKGTNGGYNLYHPRYILLRTEFLSEIKTRLKKRGN